MQYIYGTPSPDSGAQWQESWAADTDLLYLEAAVQQQKQHHQQQKQCSRSSAGAVAAEAAAAAAAASVLREDKNLILSFFPIIFGSTSSSFEDFLLYQTVSIFG